MSPTETPREAYDRGMPLRHIKRKFHMSNSEIEDMAPEEREQETHKPDSMVGGY